MRSANRDARRAERQTRRTSQRALQDQQDRARQRLGESRKRVDDVDMRQHNAIVTGVLPRLQGAVDSWCRKRVRMTVDMRSERFFAATDFDSIMINIPETQVSVDFLGDLRGLAYHEAGHIRKTVPYPRLVDMVAEAKGQTATEVQAIQGVSHAILQNAWNILEDQRMETAMVVDSKNLGRYYNVIVLTHVVSGLNPHTYAWLAARDHVDADVREAAREVMIQETDEATTERIEDCVWRYVETADPVVMWDCIVEFAQFLVSDSVDNIEFDEHNFTVESMLPGDQGILDDSATPRPMPGTPDKGQPGTGEGKNSAKPGEDDQPGDGAGNQPGNAFGRKIRDALNRAREQRNADKNLTNDMKSFNEALHDARNHTPLPRVPTTYTNTSPTDIATAVRVNRSLRLLMEAARNQAAPSWQGGQRTGILDVIRYKTRQSGDMEFFRAEAPGGDLRLPNLAVSVLLDGSGSMASYVTTLGVAAYAIKSACDVCDVPCTVSIFDTAAHLLWDAEDRPLDIPDAFCPLGGTDPTEALAVVDGQMHDKGRHLVIIMTDGSWGGWRDKSLTDYQFPNRDMVVLFWNTRPTSIRGLETCASARIDDLMEIPQIVRRYLTQAM